MATASMRQQGQHAGRRRSRRLRLGQRQEDDAGEADDQAAQPRRRERLVVEDDGGEHDREERHHGVEDAGEARRDVLLAPGDEREGHHDVRETPARASDARPHGSAAARAPMRRAATARKRLPKRARRATIVKRRDALVEADLDEQERAAPDGRQGEKPGPGPGVGGAFVEGLGGRGHSRMLDQAGDARPGRRTIGCVPAYDQTTALIVVDVQNDFADPAGSLLRPRWRDRSSRSSTPRSRPPARPARASSTRRTGTRRARRTSPRTAASGRSTASRTRGARASTPTSSSAGRSCARAPAARTATAASRCATPRRATPSDTELDGLLREAGVERVVIVGLATDYCVQATVLDARARGYPTTVLLEGIRAVDLAAGRRRAGHRADARRPAWRWIAGADAGATTRDAGRLDWRA